MVADDDLRQPDWPLRYTEQADGTVQMADVAQGSDADRRARAALVASTPIEHRDDDPEFGVTSLLWKPGPVDTGRLASEINRSDPALDVTASEVMDLLDPARRRILVDVQAA